MKEMLKMFIKHNSHVIFDVICDEHLAIFYPLPYFEMEAVNNVLSTANETLANASKYEDLTFHWITIKQIADSQFGEKFLTAFDYQIICKNAHKMTMNVKGDLYKSPEYRYPDFAVIQCDNRAHLEYTAELNFMGQLVDSNENW